jgi:hypothetical protein
MRQPKLYISILIMLVIGLHAIPVLFHFQGKRKDRIWPIMGWSMYSRSFDAARPIRTVTSRIVGVTATGEEVEMKWSHSGLGFWAFHELYVEPMWAGEASAAQGLAERVNRSREKPIIAFRLYKEIFTLTDTGILTEKAAEPVMTYRVVE